MKKLWIGLVVSSILAMSTVGYGEDPLKGWTYEKEIQSSGTTGHQAFFLDEEIYRHGNADLSDIRIINDKNEFVPYYIYNEYLETTRDINIQYDSKQILSFMKKNDHYVDFEILKQGDTADILGNTLVLDIQQRQFLKNIRVYGGYDNQTWELIKEDHIYRTDAGEKLEVILNDGYKFNYYRLVLINDVEKTSIENLKLVLDKKEEIHENYKKTKAADYKIESNDQKDTIITLNNEDHLKIHEIKIMSEGDFRRGFDFRYKEAEVKDFYYLMGGEIYQIKLDNFKAEQLSIRLDGSTGIPFLMADTLQIMIHNKDNKPIPIQGIEVSYYVDKVVFEDDGSQGYKVLFGNIDVKRPSYDLESYKVHIEKEKQEISSLGSLQSRGPKDGEKEGPPVNYRLLLNGAIAGISILLLVIILKKSGFKDV
jgi:hypothetical protein